MFSPQITEFKDYIFFFLYLLMGLLEIVQTCYFGEILKEKSGRYGEALFHSPWYKCGGQFRRSMSIFLANSNQPLELTGGGFFTLDLAKMTAVSGFAHFAQIAPALSEIWRVRFQILRATFSYYTLLNQFA